MVTVTGSGAPLRTLAGMVTLITFGGVASVSP